MMTGRGRFAIALALAMAAHALPFALPEAPDVPLPGAPLPDEVGINLVTDMAGARAGGRAEPLRRGDAAADAPPDGAADASPERAMISRETAAAQVPARVQPQAAPSDTVVVTASPAPAVPVAEAPLAAAARPAAVQPAVVQDAVPAAVAAVTPTIIEARPVPAPAAAETAVAPRAAPLPPPRPARQPPVARPAAVEPAQATPAAQRSGAANSVADTGAAEMTPVAGLPVQGPVGEASTEGRGGDMAGAGTGVTNASAGGGGAAPPDYLGQLRSWLEQHKDYPRQAQRRRIEGRVMLRFAIDRQGTVLDWAIARSSGHPVLDAAVGDMIRRATPMPAMPEGLAMARLDVVVPIDFGLR